MSSLKLGKVNLEIVHDKIRLRWTYKGERFSLSIGENTPGNLDIAKSKAYEISSNIYANSFNPAQYQPQEKSEITKNITLIKLWEIFLKDKIKSGLKAKSIEWYQGINKTILKIDNLSFDGFEVKDKLENITTTNQTRITLKVLSACCDYGIKRKLITENNFKGVWEYLPDQKVSIPYCFSDSEINLILQNFSNSKEYSYYFDLVVFWLNTGCRPSEALGLRWGDVSSNFSQITFRGSPQVIKGKGIVWSEGPKNFKKGSKRAKTRTIPLNSTLQEILKVRRSNRNLDDLIFPSPKKEYIRYENFCRRAWAKCVRTIHNLEHTTPYNLRDTFITKQLSEGVPIAVIAAWCDNSPDVIQSCYIDYASLTTVAITPKNL